MLGLGLAVAVFTVSLISLDRRWLITDRAVSLVLLDGTGRHTGLIQSLYSGLEGCHSQPYALARSNTSKSLVRPQQS